MTEIDLGSLTEADGTALRASRKQWIPEYFWLDFDFAHFFENEFYGVCLF